MTGYLLSPSRADIVHCKSQLRPLELLLTAISDALCRTYSESNRKDWERATFLIQITFQSNSSGSLCAALGDKFSAIFCYLLVRYLYKFFRYQMLTFRSYRINSGFSFMFLPLRREKSSTIETDLLSQSTNFRQVSSMYGTFS